MHSQGAAGDEGSCRGKYTAAILCINNGVYLLFLPHSWERWAHNMSVKLGETEYVTNGEQVNKTCMQSWVSMGKLYAYRRNPVLNLVFAKYGFRSEKKKSTAYGILYARQTAIQQ